jgi:thiamine kinase-like enzyme
MTLELNTEKKLHSYLTSRRIISNDTTWHSQSGGKTNKVWRLNGDKDLICKLYLDTNNNPLFNNFPYAEYECLKWLEGSGIAPKVYEFLESPFGYILLYYYIDGLTWKKDVGLVSDLLKRIRKHEPLKTLRTLSSLPVNIKADGLNILNKLESPYKENLLEACPEVIVPDIEPVLLHTDVVVGNLIFGNEGLQLIDWQCPALGDPIVDITMFLSPAMHQIYGLRDFSIIDYENFLAELSPKLRERYYTIGPLYHWRLATYCLWKAEQGIMEYEKAALLELDFMKVN